MLRVTLLGTGATMPTPERGLAAMALSCQGRTILFDCGEGTQLQMRRHHVSAARVDFIALTHYHGDHIFGLPGLLQTIACLGRTEPLYFAGPEGLERAMAPIFALAGPMPFEIRGVTLGKNGADLSVFLPGWPRGSVLSAVETAHRAASQGYVFHLKRAGRFLPEQAEKLGVQKKDWGKLQRGERVGRVKPSQVMGPERPGITVAFSGDTKPCRAFEKAAKGADLLIHEATYASEADRAEANRWATPRLPTRRRPPCAPGQSASGSRTSRRRSRTRPPRWKQRARSSPPPNARRTGTPSACPFRNPIPTEGMHETL